MDLQDIKIVCYQYLCRSEHKWPIKLNNAKQEEVKQTFEELKNLIPDKVTFKTLSASPGKFLPMLAHILY